jgi:hypothetical protein
MDELVSGIHITMKVKLITEPCYQHYENLN